MSCTAVIIPKKIKRLIPNSFVKSALLNEYKKYLNNLNGCTYYGDYYMKIGVNLCETWRNEFGCELLILEEV